jgi:hypothetical protein
LVVRPRACPDWNRAIGGPQAGSFFPEALNGQNGRRTRPAELEPSVTARSREGSIRTPAGCYQPGTTWEIFFSFFERKKTPASALAPAGATEQSTIAAIEWRELSNNPIFEFASEIFESVK